MKNHRVSNVSFYLALSCEERGVHVIRGNVRHWRVVDELVVDGAHELVEHHDGRLRHDELAQPEVGPLLLDRVRNRLAVFLVCK